MSSIWFAHYVGCFYCTLPFEKLLYSRTSKFILEMSLHTSKNVYCAIIVNSLSHNYIHLHLSQILSQIHLHLSHELMERYYNLKNMESLSVLRASPFSLCITFSC